MRIIRVFPRRTSFTPNDRLAFVGDPPLDRPEADEVHVSCCFTWDLERAKRLQSAWGQYYPVVKLGGPGLGNVPYDFKFGRYVKPGVTFTSRGCDNECPWCLVPGTEGRLREHASYPPGNIIQDNNLLQCSDRHIEDVIEMLSYVGKAVTFSGGLEADRVTDRFVDQIRSLSIHELWFACDRKQAIFPLKKALSKLTELTRNQKRCYVLIGFNETIDEARKRLSEVLLAGCYPFAQLYQPPDKYIEYSHDWLNLRRTFERPAAMYSLLKELEA